MRESTSTNSETGDRKGSWAGLNLTFLSKQAKPDGIINFLDKNVTVLRGSLRLGGLLLANSETGIGGGIYGVYLSGVPQGVVYLP